MNRRTAFCILALAATTVPAQASRLTGDAIASTVAGNTIVLQTSFGGFPLSYDRRGAVTGDGTGVGLARFFAPKETGKWWVAGDKLCQVWPTWYDGKAHCFELYRAGEGALRWRRDDGYSGTARITAN